MPKLEFDNKASENISPKTRAHMDCSRKYRKNCLFPGRFKRGSADLRCGWMILHRLVILPEGWRMERLDGLTFEFRACSG
jgi:hypothetical protein